jgi:hypothetical protein
MAAAAKRTEKAVAIPDGAELTEHARDCDASFLLLAAY